ncbi:hypothetical protein ACS0TY_014454 [Phlomoides rotata]
MGKGKRLEAELQLPEAIIQHIQSFMSGKEAAQTTLLSKSDLTRPDLDFDQEDFVGKSDYYDTRRSGEKGLWKFVNKTVERIDVDTLFFDDFSSKFPCLKDLSLHGCGGYKGIKIYSPSLECISFTQDRILRAKFDIPSIRKFTFSGAIPSLSFKTTTNIWECDISISCCRSPSAKWILKLNKLLTKLSLSKVSLTLKMYFRRRFDCVQDINVLLKPQVENLVIDGFHGEYPNCPELFDVLFRCCRPIYITQVCNFGTRSCDFMEFVYKRVMQDVSLKCSSTNQSVSGERHLVGVDVEYFDRAISAWRPQLLDASTKPVAGKQRIRLHLRWGC